DGLRLRESLPTTRADESRPGHRQSIGLHHNDGDRRARQARAVHPDARPDRAGISCRVPASPGQLLLRDPGEARSAARRENRRWLPRFPAGPPDRAVDRTVYATDHVGVGCWVSWEDAPHPLPPPPQRGGLLSGPVLNARSIDYEHESRREFTLPLGEG